MKIGHTRTLIRAALAGQLDHVPYALDPVFNLEVPQQVPGVPTDVLNPRQTWSDRTAYDEQARRLARMFTENFKAFEDDAAPEVVAAGPGKG
jgi:phosphoenolpyruvate carboxykinase (ATP)